MTLMLTTHSFAKAENFNINKEQKKLSNKVFEHYDKNHNKGLSLQEFSTFSKDMKHKELEKRVEMIIKSCDTNGNGDIELNEIPSEEEIISFFEKHSFREQQKICHFQRGSFNDVDQNDDNISSKKELMAFHNPSHFSRPRFEKPNETEIKKRALKGFKMQLKRCDTNKDKNITLIEITSEKCFMTSDVFLEYSSNPKSSFSIDNVEHTPIYNRNGFETMIQQCDKDNDNKLNLIEATSEKCHLSSDTFTRIDLNKDNLLVQEELMKENKKKSQAIPFPMLNEKVFKHMPKQVQINMTIGMCDKNHDRNFTIQEAKDCNLSIEKFKEFDTDKSNSIEPNDIEKIISIEEFKTVDIDGNNKIEANEFFNRMGSRCRVF